MSSYLLLLRDDSISLRECPKYIRDSIRLESFISGSGSMYGFSSSFSYLLIMFKVNKNGTRLSGHGEIEENIKTRRRHKFE